MENGQHEPQDTSQAIDAVFKHAAEVRDYALLYIETRKDQIKVQIRRLITYAALGALALVAGATMLAAAVVLLLIGVARGLGVLLGDNLWAGEMITGGALLLLAAAGIFFGVRSRTKTSRRRITEKYERRRQELRNRFGREAAPRCPVGESHQ